MRISDLTLYSSDDEYRKEVDKKVMTDVAAHIDDTDLYGVVRTVNEFTGRQWTELTSSSLFLQDPLTILEESEED